MDSQIDTRQQQQQQQQLSLQDPPDAASNGIPFFQIDSPTLSTQGSPTPTLLSPSVSTSSLSSDNEPECEDDATEAGLFAATAAAPNSRCHARKNKPADDSDANIFRQPTSPLPPAVEQQKKEQQQKQSSKDLQLFESLNFDDPNEAANPDISANELRARSALRYALAANPAFDNFTIVEMIGFGSNGVVLSARPNTASAATATVSKKKNKTATLAIKIIYKSSHSAHMHTHSDPYPDEVLLHRRLTAFHAHPSILRAHSHFQDLRHFYLVTDLIDTDHLRRFTGALPSCRVKFRNPRTGVAHVIPVSPGGRADLWAWSVDATTPAMPTDGPPTANPKPIPPEVEACRELFAALAAGLRHLHRLGVHHGDIKPENVLVPGLGEQCSAILVMRDTPRAVHLATVERAHPLGCPQ